MGMKIYAILVLILTIGSKVQGHGRMGSSRSNHPTSGPFAQSHGHSHSAPPEASPEPEAVIVDEEIRDEQTQHMTNSPTEKCCPCKKSGHKGKYGYKPKYSYGYKPKYDYGYKPMYDHDYKPKYDYDYKPQYEYGYQPQYEYGYQPQYQYGYQPQYGYQSHM